MFSISSKQKNTILIIGDVALHIRSKILEIKRQASLSDLKHYIFFSYRQIKHIAVPQIYIYIAHGIRGDVDYNTGFTVNLLRITFITHAVFLFRVISMKMSFWLARACILGKRKEKKYARKYDKNPNKDAGVISRNVYWSTIWSHLL